MELLEELLQVERRLWTNDADVYRDNLLPEAQLVFMETGVIFRDVAVEAIRAENAEGRRWAEVDITEASARRLTEDVAVLTYKVAARWNYETVPGCWLASSVYVAREGRWRLGLHQQSALSAGPA
ncbi:nuclear transport factor 2 family protein [Phenylobacterium terrae]|uniref:Nuclear transport factor 2 family protein n=1 Tax=Phenylobacterium terrae TaxID=2665495 RepID=A0ABW4MZ45_9CAUL